MTTPLTGRQEEILTGLMLGDGSLFKYRQSFTAYLAVHRARRDIDYQRWLVNECPEWFPRGVIEGASFDKRTRITYEWARLVSRVSPIFDEWYSVWYPNAKKAVPPDLHLTPLVIAVWLCDDGNVRQLATKRARRGILQTKFATLGFPDDDVRRLADMLSRRYGSPFTLARERGSGLNIYGANTATRAMIEEIDPVIPDAMSRKAFWRTPEGQPPDGPGRQGYLGERTHCAQGHEWSTENTRISPKGIRQCRTCIRLSVAVIRDRERDEARAWGLLIGWPNAGRERLPRGLGKAYREHQQVQVNGLANDS